MKKLFIIFAFLLYGSFGHPQVNFPLIVSDRTWSIVEHDPHGGATTTTAYKFENDTIINGKSYYLVYECYLDSTLTIWSLFQNCFVREDSLGNFYKLVNATEEQLYDFSLEVGDSIFTGYQIAGHDVYARVDTVDFIMINQEFRKRIVFDPYFQETWIEGIGSLTHILFPFSSGLSTLSFELLCVSDSGNIIYQNGEYQDCYVYIVGDNELTKVITKVKIYPNPASTHITIESSPSSQLSILNLNGQELMKQTSTEPKTVIEISSLPNGVYFVRVTGDKAVNVGMFVKQ